MHYYIVIFLLNFFNIQFELAHFNADKIWNKMLLYYFFFLLYELAIKIKLKLAHKI